MLLAKIDFLLKMSVSAAVPAGGPPASLSPEPFSSPGWGCICPCRAFLSASRKLVCLADRWGSRFGPDMPS